MGEILAMSTFLALSGPADETASLVGLPPTLRAWALGRGRGRDVDWCEVHGDPGSID